MPRCPFADGAFDGVVCGFALRNFVDLGAVFAECARVLRPGGRFAALDATVPTNPIMRAGERGVVPRRGARCSAACSRTTPTRTATCRRSTAYLPPRPIWRRVSASAGFHDVALHTFTGGSVLLLTGDARMTTTPAPARLRAVTREVDPGRRRRSAGFDPPTASRGCTTGLRLVATGVAARVAADDVDAHARRRSTPTTRSRSRAPARSRWARCPFDPDAPASW